jgi:hypothetical protein
MIQAIMGPPLSEHEHVFEHDDVDVLENVLVLVLAALPHCPANSFHGPFTFVFPPGSLAQILGSYIASASTGGIANRPLIVARDA